MARQTVTYETRPPKSARAARRAWDYFVEANKGPIKCLFYSSNYKGDGPAWVMEFKISENATNWWWGGDVSWMTAAVRAYELTKIQ